MIRLVATDLDGTLLHSDGSVTERTRAALDRLEERGVLVVFVSGRPIRWMEPLWPHVGYLGLAICSNGGIVYDVPGRRVVEALTIPPEVGLEVADLVRDAVPGSAFAVERTGGFGREPEYVPDRPPREGEAPQVAPLEELFDDSVVKMIAIHHERDPEDYWAAVEKAAGHLVTTTWSSVSALVEMSGHGVTKASTLARVCAERSIGRDEVLAFGDMPNDVGLLEWAGTSYAMGNAHPLAAAAADRRAPSNDEDGVAAVLEELFGQ